MFIFKKKHFITLGKKNYHFNEQRFFDSYKNIFILKKMFYYFKKKKNCHLKDQIKAFHLFCLFK